MGMQDGEVLPEDFQALSLCCRMELNSMSGLDNNCVLVESACRPEPGQRLIIGPWVFMHPSRLTRMER